MGDCIDLERHLMLESRSSIVVVIGQFLYY